MRELYTNALRWSVQNTDGHAAIRDAWTEDWLQRKDSREHLRFKE